MRQMIKWHSIFTLIGAVIFLSSCEEQQPIDTIKEGNFDEKNYMRPKLNWNVADNRDTAVTIKINVIDTGYRRISKIYFEYSEDQSLQSGVKTLTLNYLSSNKGLFDINNLRVGASYWGRLIVQNDIDTFIYGVYSLNVKVNSLRRYFTGLVAWYPFTSSSGAFDESGNDFHGFTWELEPSQDRFGQVNCAYSFNGKSSYISVFRSEDMSSIASASYTYACWIKRDSVDINGPLAPIIEKAPTQGQNFFSLSISPNGSISCDAYANNISFSTVPFLILDEWCFLTVTYDWWNEKVVFYVNGKEALNYSSSIKPVIIHNNRLRFGRSIAGEKYFKGEIDDISIWNRALTAAEVMELYKL